MSQQTSCLIHSYIGTSSYIGRSQVLFCWCVQSCLGYAFNRPSWRYSIVCYQSSPAPLRDVQVDGDCSSPSNVTGAPPSPVTNKASTGTSRTGSPFTKDCFFQESPFRKKSICMICTERIASSRVTYLRIAHLGIDCLRVIVLVSLFALGLTLLGLTVKGSTLSGSMIWRSTF